MYFKFAVRIVAVMMLLLFSQNVLAEESNDESGVKIKLEPGKGLDVASADGDFRIVTKLFAQLQYTATGDRDEDEWEQSFQVRRARLIFTGNAFGEHNKYYIQLALSPKDLQFKDGSPTKSPVFDWFFTFDYLRDLSVQVGQYRIPYTKQRRVPIAKLQFIDRTIGNFEFNLDRDIGFDLQSQDFLGLDLLRYHAGVFIGEGRDGFEASDFGMIYVARLELFPLGLFDDYIEADLERRKRLGIALAAAYSYVDNAKWNRGILGSVPSDGGTTDTHNATADIMLKIAGVSLFSEFYYRVGKRKYGDVQALDDNGDPVFDDAGNPVVDREQARDGLGWFAQMGWLLPRIPVEIVGRYSQVHPVGDSSSLTRKDEVGAGINWYIHGPIFALSTDYHYRFDDGKLDSGSDELRVRFQAGF